MNNNPSKMLRHNITANIMDGAFFGFAFGFASFSTVIPLFVSTMTKSAILIGMIPAIHNMGWQLPQLLIANRVAKQTRYRPMMMILTTMERLPFLGLAVIAYLIPVLHNTVVLVITFLLLVMQGLAGGLTATPWSSLMAKIIPSERRGTFFGLQSSAANLLASLGAILAGYMIQGIKFPLNFVACFLCACAALVVSWFSLAQTREEESIPSNDGDNQHQFFSSAIRIYRSDAFFRKFLFVRILSQFAVMAFSFYTVYSVEKLGMSAIAIGFLTSVLLGAQIIANPVMGWLGDQASHRTVMEVGILAASGSALIALVAHSTSWFFLAFILAGIANVAIWTISLTMTLDFGSEQERPAYIGLANTFVAPFTMLAPIFGGWLADGFGYSATFIASIVGGLVTAMMLHSMRNLKA